MFLNMTPYRKQHGGALIITVFIIVVMSALAVGITRTMSSSTDQVVYEVMGTRALMAAETGNEMVLMQLFPLNGTVRTCSDIDTTVSSDDVFNEYFVADELSQCTVTATCTERTQGTTTYYSIASTGVCKDKHAGTKLFPATADYTCANTDAVCVSRRLEVEAKTL